MKHRLIIGEQSMRVTMKNEKNAETYKQLSENDG
jgi:hypothetical protein